MVDRSKGCERTDAKRFILKQYWVQILSVHLHPFRYTTPTRLVACGSLASRRPATYNAPIAPGPGAAPRGPRTRHTPAGLCLARRRGGLADG
eukprot:930393-Prymnesium_polylepis.1